MKSLTENHASIQYGMPKWMDWWLHSLIMNGLTDLDRAVKEHPEKLVSNARRVTTGDAGSKFN